MVSIFGRTESKMVAVDALTYSGFKVLAALYHLELAAIPCRAEGPDLQALHTLCQQRRVRAVYTMPTLHNPLGWVLNAGQRQVLADLARQHDLLIIEDAAYALDTLRALSATAQQALAQTRDLLGARGALVQHLSQTLAATSRNWSTRMGSLAAAAQAGSDSPELSVEAPQEIHRQLQQHVAQALAGCARLASLEEAAATSLDQMAQQIAAARAA